MGIARALLHGVDIANSDWGMQSLDWKRWIRFKCRMRNYRPFFMVESESKNGRTRP
jgi:hypothetical protein